MDTAEAKSAIVRSAIEGAQAFRAVLPRLKPRHAQALTGVSDSAVAKAILANPRFVRRLLPMIATVVGLADDTPCPHGLRPLLDEARFKDAAIKIGLMFNLKRFGSIIMKRDLAAFERVYGAEALDFALRHIAAAPPAPTQDRIPAAAFDIASARRAGTLALLNWAHARFGEQSRWLDAVIDMNDTGQINERLAAVIDRLAPDLGLGMAA